eukprot:8141432-Pyramimonas_sp.AAC.1
MDNPNRVNVAITRATTNVVIIGDGTMFGTATGAHLRELSEHGRLAKLWVRFRGTNLGKRALLQIDEAFDPIGDLTTWIPPSPTYTGDDSIKGLDDAIKKVKASMESSFAYRIAAPLDP